MADATTTTRNDERKQDYTDSFCLLAREGKHSSHQQLEILVDVDDYKHVARKNWRIYRFSQHKYPRIIAQDHSTNSKRVFLHRLLMNAPSGMVVDHIDRDPCDNRKHNLRVCTQGQNCLNRRQIDRAVSRFKGVCWNKVNQRWIAQAGTRANRRFLGFFDSEVEAARAYNSAAAEMYGDFACLNPV
ncbi:HNH endonuclease [Zavarzinella formosa]|uniref:HNH endonuclease n=1 Tax=Zavarzinella formosa TaxID=360055 RepID=UPI00036BA5C5|nr:HNH endonuclease [Zavarzinella formosa]